MDNSILTRAHMTARVLTQRRLRCYKLVASQVADRTGIEIGGPSVVFGQSYRYLPIYRHIRLLDNCDFSPQTAWANHSEKFQFHKNKAPGRNIFADGSCLSMVADHSYDFVLSSHNLEHFANPVKALKEWQRIAVPGGVLVLVLPNFRYTFDHRRQPTAVGHMLADHEQNTPESDLSHLPEILEKHDLSLDPAAGTPEEFRRRSLANFENRCLHHHVFDERNVHELLTALGMDVLALEAAWPFNIFAIARMPKM